jgi:hypothetical protein
MIYKVPDTELDSLLKILQLPQKPSRQDLFLEGVLLAPKGLYLEFGVHVGTSMRELLHILEDRPVYKVYGFDVFTKEMPDDFTEFWERGIFVLQPEAVPKFDSRVEIIEGYYEDTLIPFLEKHTEPVAFIHMDSDIYSSTKYILNTLSDYNRIQTGTIIQFDDLFIREKNYWYNGEYLAFTEWIKERGLSYRYLSKYVTQVLVQIL